MDAWLLSLETTPLESLKDMKEELTRLVTAGKAAAKTLDTVVIKIRDFREVGERHQLFTKVNAERRQVYGALGKIGIATPGLTWSFQDQFFKLGDVGDEPEDTIDSVEAEIKELEARLAERGERLAALKQEAAGEAQAAAERVQKALKLAELKKEIEAKKKEAQALQDELT